MGAGQQGWTVPTSRPRGEGPREVGVAPGSPAGVGLWCSWALVSSSPRLSRP